MLARACMDALQPNLIILDEFQRFSDLLRKGNPTAELAHELFEYKGRAGEPAPRTLLLSATPYRMYSTSAEEEDHYSDFMQTLSFLANGNDAATGQIRRDLQQLREDMFTAGSADGNKRIARTRNRLQNNLMRLMCRTERVGLTARHDAMLTEERLEADLETGDLKQLQALGSIGDILDTGSVVEYWKSSPYLLNFMKDYKIKTRFDSALGTRPEIRRAVRQHRNAFLPTHKIRSLKAIDPGNLKLRPLIAEIEQQQLWRLLWMPPSLPYWQPAGEYRNIGSISKH